MGTSSQPRQIVSRAQARKLIEKAARGEIKGRDGLSGVQVVADMLKRAPNLNSLPERVGDKR